MKRILIVGCGGIGERHLRCFMKTGRANVVACEPNAERREWIYSKLGVTPFADLKSAWDSGTIDGAVICTPANTHIEIALAAMERNAAALIEKPLSVTFDKVPLLIEEARRRNAYVRVAYVNRLRPGCREIREVLARGEFGPVLQASVVTGQHFPTYRPDYQRIYYARHETGGGAIQDALTHMANLMEWYAGPPSRVFCEAAHRELPGVNVEDTVSVVARNGQAFVTHSLNQFQAPFEVLLQCHCAGGSVRMDFQEQNWGVCRRGETRWKNYSAPLKDRDDLFVAQANAFLDGMEGKPTSLCTLEEAADTLRFNLAALESMKTGQPIDIVA